MNARRIAQAFACHITLGGGTESNINAAGNFGYGKELQAIQDIYNREMYGQNATLTTAGTQHNTPGGGAGGPTNAGGPPGDGGGAPTPAGGPIVPAPQSLNAPASAPAPDYGAGRGTLPFGYNWGPNGSIIGPGGTPFSPPQSSSATPQSLSATSQSTTAGDPFTAINTGQPLSQMELQAYAGILRSGQTVPGLKWDSATGQVMYDRQATPQSAPLPPEPTPPPPTNPRPPIIPTDPGQPPTTTLPPYGTPPPEPIPTTGTRYAPESYQWGSGGASGNRLAAGATTYQAYVDQLQHPELSQEVQNAITQQGMNATRAGFAGQAGQAARHRAVTGNSAGYGAGTAQLGRDEAGAYGMQARQNTIDFEKEAQRRREAAQAGVSNLYQGESQYQLGLLGGQAGVSGKLYGSQSGTRATQKTDPLVAL